MTPAQHIKNLATDLAVLAILSATCTVQADYAVHLKNVAAARDALHKAIDALAHQIHQD